SHSRNRTCHLRWSQPSSLYQVSRGSGRPGLGFAQGQAEPPEALPERLRRGAEGQPEMSRRAEEAPGGEGGLVALAQALQQELDLAPEETGEGDHARTERDGREVPSALEEAAHLGL